MFGNKVQLCTCAISFNILKTITIAENEFVQETNVVSCCKGFVVNTIKKQAHC